MRLFIEKDLSIYEDYFRLDRKKFLSKRIAVSLTLVVLFLVMFMVLKSNILLWLLPVIAIVGYKLPYIDLVRKKNKDDIIKQYMFPTFLRYFISLLDTQGNVYQTLRATVSYLNDPLKTEVIKMIVKLEEQNVNNRDAFLDFAEFIGSSEAHMIMGMIYEFHEEGISKDDIRELEKTIKELQENKTNELIELKVNSLDKHANPIMAYGLIYIFGFTALVFISYLKSIPF